MLHGGSKVTSSLGTSVQSVNTHGSNLITLLFHREGSFLLQGEIINMNTLKGKVEHFGKRVEV